MAHTLDIRQLADEWHAAVEDLNERTNESASYGELVDVESPYWELCDELGIEKSPDALKSYGDNHDATLIAERDFAEYARDFAEDIGAIDTDRRWPLYCIDWERAAADLAMDYMSVTFDGTNYYIRG